MFCCKLSGCAYLSMGHAIDHDAVITEEKAGQCKDWFPISPWQVETREALNQLAGEANTLRTLYELPDMVLDGLREGELLERMIEETPNFAAMRWEGMTVSERRQQLEFQTDDDGNVILEIDKEGTEFPLRRESYQLKAWATLPEPEGGEIGLPLKVAWLWQAEPLIKHILDFEVEQGLIVKDQKESKGKPKDKTTGKAEVTAAPPSTDRENQSMATTPGRPVRVARTTSPKTASAPAPGKPRTAGKPAGKTTGKSAAPPAAGGRVARPPRRPGAPASIPAGEAQSSAPAFDMTECKTMVTQVVRAENEALLNEIRAIAATLMDGVTIFYDMAVQTGGQFSTPVVDSEDNYVADEDGNVVMEALPQLFDKPSKLLAFVDGTAYDDEEEPGEGEE